MYTKLKIIKNIKIKQTWVFFLLLAKSVPLSKKTIENREKETRVENSIENYQNLLKLNNIIEKKFQKDIKNINEKTKEKILKITSKRNAK